MRRTYITAIAIAVVAVLWFASGQLRDEPATPPASIAEQNRLAASMSEERPPTRVRVSMRHASDQVRLATIRGRTENKRTVVVRSQVDGTLVERPVERGDAVKEGDLLCRISVEDRQAALGEARAAREQAHIEYEGSVRLSREGLQSETLIAQAKARLAAAESNVMRSELDVARLEITAPFDGVIEDVQLEQGDYVTPGAACAVLVDLDPMLLTGRIPESEFSHVKLGSTAVGVVSTGVEVSGVVSFIGKIADEVTRTYAIEVHVANEDLTIPSGVSVRIEVPVEAVRAQQISPALLALDDEGRIGVRTIDEQNVVHFNLIEIISDATDGIWVTGLPDLARVITVGQEFVIPGEVVDPVYVTN
jgi:membrane fusion protein, multidrug efflux system